MINVKFFRGAGAWYPDNLSDHLSDTLEKAYGDQVSIEYTQAHVVWDSGEWFGFIKRYFRRRELKGLLVKEANRDKNSQADFRHITDWDKAPDIADAVDDVVSFLMRPGVAEDYSDLIQMMARSEAINLRADHSRKLVLMGHSLGTCGAYLYLRYLMNLFNRAEWEALDLENRITLVLVSPAMGFPTVRNKVARFLPKVQDTAVRIKRSIVITGTEDVLYKIPTYDVVDATRWVPNLASRAVRVSRASGLGHDFGKLVTQGRPDLWNL